MTTRLANNTNNLQHKPCNPENKREQHTLYLPNITEQSPPTHDQKQKLCYSINKMEQFTPHFPHNTAHNSPTTSTIFTRNSATQNKMEQFTPYLPNITAHSSPTHCQKHKLHNSENKREQHTLYLPDITAHNSSTITIRQQSHKWMSFETWANAQVSKLKNSSIYQLAIADRQSEKKEKATSTKPCIRQRFVLSPTRCYHESSK